jgi:hypothetical protein
MKDPWGMSELELINEVIALRAKTNCPECGGSGLTMQPGMPDGEPEGLPCPRCSLEAENKRLKTIAEYVYDDMRKEAWEEAAAYFRHEPSPSCLESDGCEKP